MSSSPVIGETSDIFSWYNPSVDDSKPMTWNEFVALHMKQPTSDDPASKVSPKTHLQAVANRWKRRDPSLKLTGRSERSRITSHSVQGMYGLAGGKIKKAKTIASQVRGDAAEDSTSNKKKKQEILKNISSLLKTFKEPSNTPKTVTSVVKKKTENRSASAIATQLSPSVHDSDVDTVVVEDNAEDKTQHKQSHPLKNFATQTLQKSGVDKHVIHTTLKNRRIFTRCLQEACQDIEQQQLTAREALLLGVSIPFDYLTRNNTIRAE